MSWKHESPWAPGGADRRDDDDAPASYRVHLCFGPNCSPRGSRALLPILEAAIRRAGIGDRVEVIASTCRDRCDFGPSMNVYPGPTFYNHLTEEAIEEIVREHLVGGKRAERWVFRPPPVGRVEPRSKPRIGPSKTFPR